MLPWKSVVCAEALWRWKGPSYQGKLLECTDKAPSEHAHCCRPQKRLHRRPSVTGVLPPRHTGVTSLFHPEGTTVMWAFGGPWAGSSPPPVLSLLHRVFPEALETGNGTISTLHTGKLNQRSRMNCYQSFQILLSASPHTL